VLGHFAEFDIAEQEIHTKLDRGDKRKVATGRKRRPQDKQELLTWSGQSLDCVGNVVLRAKWRLGGPKRNW
jgi:hypothetical protein